MKTLSLATALMACLSSSVLAQKAYDPGASDAEIKIGMTAPLSGPVSGYGVSCGTFEAFFKMTNEKGGVNGRKINFTCEDDAYSPPKTVEKTRKLVESDDVLFMFASIGAGANAAVQKYLNQKAVPQIFINSGASRFNNPKEFPYSMPAVPNYHTEAKLFADHIRKNSPNAKVALFFQNDDFGKDYLNGLKDGWGDDTSKFLLATEPFEVSEPTIDSHIVKLKATGADVVVLAAVGKQATQTIRKIAELNWKTTIYITWGAANIPLVFEPAGLQNSVGIISTAIYKDIGDPGTAKDPDTIAYMGFMEKYAPSMNAAHTTNAQAYVMANVLLDVLSRAGDNLTRSNIMKMVGSIDIAPPLFRPGLRFKTAPDDYDGIKTFKMMRFDGKGWVEATGL